jgi:hypothetical protein
LADARAACEKAEAVVRGIFAVFEFDEGWLRKWK